MSDEAATQADEGVHRIARHDGTEYFTLPFNVEGGVPDHVITYFPVPGGVVMYIDIATAQFIPTCRLEYDLTKDGKAANVRLTSTLPQMMMGAMAMANAADLMTQLGQQEGGG